MALCRRADGNALSASTQRGGYNNGDSCEAPLSCDGCNQEKSAADRTEN